MIKVGVAIGIGVGVFLGLCCLWWGARKLRAWMKEGKISATLEEILVSFGSLPPPILHLFPSHILPSNTRRGLG